MELYNSDKHANKRIVASIGFFDGVHKGHQFLIEQVKKEAKKRDALSCVITFAEHPRKVLEAAYQPSLLCSYEEKIEHLDHCGLDLCIPIHFTKQLAELSAYDFMEQVLKKTYNIDTLIIGYDHRFGHKRQDNFESYTQYGKELDINVVKAEELPYSEGHLSSSLIRRQLGEGQIILANSNLTYNYSITGKIIEGFKVGRTIGFPTANISVWERFKVIPKHGVYAVRVKIGSDLHQGMLYIGRRPTINTVNEATIEVNIFNFNGDLYGKTITVYFLKFIRHDIKFTTVELLQHQLRADEQAVRKFFEES